ncbi:hypothetical protein EPUS_00308 [Endocarpon pusillum Z07020]|uniref:Uncharacterized protein n=1 Tax=Endocarpon pusillum (strain Z07020 / HMAS-L-300199) TaxID=1263415 RepID=U1GEJ4_ENDPU|nr:uncharacterized protein EPUS_00308 [Endocarpon pusillum Z07020]ERF70121.1 hypothetical protein EPUS_00308 [Endocarpon pusillum Z07020]
MDKSSTPAKPRPKREMQDEVSDADDAGTSNPTPGGRNNHAQKRRVRRAPASTEFDIQDRAGQGLSVSIGGAWRPAIWHHRLVIGLDREKYGVHLYDTEPPRRGDDQPTEDITTFLAGQKSWAFGSKEGRPSILFQLYPKIDQYPDRNKVVPWLEWEIDGETKIVLDVVSRSPLRDFKNIPVQLASNVEGGRLEAMGREDSRITSSDFLQHMIPLLNENGEPKRDEKGVILSDRPSRHVLDYVRTQFRNQCRCLSWRTLRYGSVFDRQLLKDITKQDKDANTTRNLPDLSHSEISAIRSSARNAELDKGIGARLAAKDESQLDSARNSPKQSGTKVYEEDGTADLPEYSDVDDLPDVLLDQTSGNNTPAQRRGNRASRKMSKLFDVAGTSSQTLVGDTVQTGFEVIDPALLTPAASQITTITTTTTEHAEPSTKNTGQNTPQLPVTTLNIPATSSPPTADTTKAVSAPRGSASPSLVTSAPSTDTQDPSDPSADSEKAVQSTAATKSTAVTKTRPVLSLNTATTEEQLGNDLPSPKRRCTTNEGGDPDSDSIQVTNNSKLRTQSPELSLQHQNIASPPYPTNVQELLEQFGATSRPGGAASPLLNSGAVNTTISSTQEKAQPVNQSSESPQPNSPDEALPAIPTSATPIRSRSVSPAPAMPSSYQPIQPRPAPPSPMLHHNQMQMLSAEQARFAATSDRVSSLELSKARLFNAWLKDQADTSDGAALYGPRFNISLSSLGSNNSARTDAEMRTFMSSYNIPGNWSASSIDLRQNEELRQAVHQAICEAAHWDARNYVENSNLSRVDLSTDGGFFLARAFWASITPNDCRFWNFTSTEQLNRSLHAALWRYRQLTGRALAAPGHPAFLAVETSYHDAWCEIYRQIFLPYFLRFKDPVEAACWAPQLGMLAKWEGGAESWARSPTHVQDGFACRFDVEGRGALDPRRDATMKRPSRP